MKRIFVLVVFLAVLLSCKKEIEFKGEYKAPKLVLNTLLLKDSLAKVDISNSVFVLDDSNPASVSNAMVKLYKNSTFIEYLHFSNNRYYSTHKIEANQGYSIQVSADGFEDIHANTYIPQSISFDVLDTNTVLEENGERYLQFDIKFDLKDDIDEYFLLKCYKLFHSTEEYQAYSSPVSIKTNDLIVNEIKGHGFLFLDQLISHKSYIFRGSVNYSNFRKVDLVFELYSLNKDMYDYFITENLSSKDGFMMEPVIVYSNVSSGMGIMGGGAVKRDTLELKMNNDSTRAALK